MNAGGPPFGSERSLRADAERYIFAGRQFGDRHVKRRRPAVRFMADRHVASCGVHGFPARFSAAGTCYRHVVNVHAGFRVAVGVRNRKSDDVRSGGRFREFRLQLRVRPELRRADFLSERVCREGVFPPRAFAERHDPVRAEAAALAEFAALEHEHVVVDAHHNSLAARPRRFAPLYRRIAGQRAVGELYFPVGRNARRNLHARERVRRVIDRPPVGGAYVAVAEERERVCLVAADCVAHRREGTRMRHQEKRLAAFVEAERRAELVDLPCRFHLVDAPLAPEEVISFDFLVPDVFVLLAPDAFPMFFDVGGENVPGAEIRGGVDVADVGVHSLPLKVVVPGHRQQFDLVPVRRLALGEHPAPYFKVALDRLHLAVVRHVAAVQYHIDVGIAEIFEGASVEGVRPRTRGRAARTRRPEMRVAHKADYEIRAAAGLPAAWRGEETSAAGDFRAYAGGKRVENTLEKTAPVPCAVFTVAVHDAQYTTTAPPRRKETRKNRLTGETTFGTLSAVSPHWADAKKKNEKENE